MTTTPTQHATDPGGLIDLAPLKDDLQRLEMSLHHAVTVHLAAVEQGWAQPGELDMIRERCIAADAAEATWQAAVEHNSVRRVTAQEGIAAARESLAAGVARRHGHLTRAQDDEERCRERVELEREGLV